MNRKQRRDLKYGRKGTNLNDPEQAQEMLESLPDATLVAGINNSLGILQKRGVIISDWDNKKRELYRLKVFGRKVCFLASELDRSGQISSKENDGNGLQQEEPEEK
ncbi:MAG: FAD binding domain-containing protein [Lachnospiraceae bacterium]